MRLFAAIDIPEPLRETLAALQNDEELSARWTSPEQFHVTLRFIGEVNKQQARRYSEALSNVTVPPPRCVPQEPAALGALPSRHAPSVLMLELKRTDSLMALYRAVSDALEGEGLDPEDRKYRPHVTIGRLDDGEPETVHRFLRAHDDHTFEPFTANRFVFYESILGPDGATHEPFASFDFPEA